MLLQSVCKYEYEVFISEQSAIKTHIHVQNIQLQRI